MAWHCDECGCAVVCKYAACRCDDAERVALPNGM